MSTRLYFSQLELNPRGYLVTPEIEANMYELIVRVSAVRELFGRPMVVTSGLRSREDQERIYRNAKSVPYGSMHLIGAAVDIADRDKTLAGFVTSKDGLKLLEDVGLWIEDPSYTHSWVHFQIKPPKSGNRIFKP